MMKAVIFCNGNIDRYEGLKEKCVGNLVICADGGLRHTKYIGIKPDIIIGDNDSKGNIPSDAQEVYVYPVKKDDTDTKLCVDCAIEKGCDEIEILGGTGGRLDHEYSHYCLMAYALERGVCLTVTNECNKIFMKDKPFVVERGGYKYISFFPYGGKVEGFAVSGLEYKAENMTLDCSLVQATSNEFSDEESAEISFDSGRLLVMMCNDAK